MDISCLIFFDSLGTLPLGANPERHDEASTCKSLASVGE